MDEQVPHRLRSIVSSRGTGLATDPRLVRALLGDLCPDRPLEVSLLVTAVEEGTTATLLDRPVGLPVDHLTSRLTADLITARGLSREAAGWAVEAWAFALGARPEPGAGTGSGGGGSSGGAPDHDLNSAGATTAEVARVALAAPVAFAAPASTAPPPGPPARPHHRPAPPVPPPAPPLPPETGSPRPGAGRTRAVWLVAGAAALAVLLVAVVATVLLSRGGGSHPAANRTPSATPTGPARAGKQSATSAGAAGPLVVLAHEGGGETYAEETMPAMLDAARSGAAVEADVRWTSDGVAVMAHGAKTSTAKNAWIHDSFICSDRVHVIAKTRYSVLRAHCRSTPGESKDGAAYAIPVFDEVMKQISAIPGAQVFVEVKTDDQTAAQDRTFLGVIEKYGMVDRTVVTSYFQDALARIVQQATKDKITIRRLLFLPSSDSKALPKASLLAGEGLWGVCVRSDLVIPTYFSSLKASHLVALAEQKPPSDHRQKPRDLPKLWSAMRAAGAATMLTDQPGAYRRWLR